MLYPFLNGKGYSNKELPHVLFASYNCVTFLMHADYSHARQLQLEHFRSVYKADDSKNHFYLWCIGNINAAYIIKKSQIQFLIQCNAMSSMPYILSVFSIDLGLCCVVLLTGQRYISYESSIFFYAVRMWSCSL